jgi:hypothetical protein
VKGPLTVADTVDAGTFGMSSVRVVGWLAKTVPKSIDAGKRGKLTIGPDGIMPPPTWPIRSETGACGGLADVAIVGGALTTPCELATPPTDPLRP